VKQGAGTVGFVITLGAVVLGYEAIQLMRGLKPLSGLTTAPSGGPVAGGGSGSSGGGSVPSGQQGYSQLPAGVQADIEAALQRAVQAGQLKSTDLPNWRDALAGILGHENVPMNPYAVYGDANATAGSAADANALATNQAAGLFQTLPSTFRGFYSQGNIWNPVDSAYVAIQEIRANWGGDPWAPLRNNPYKGY
jgi:hypothetical protein